MIGETVGNYRILSVIGAGGMGVVYLAEHTMIGRRAAIKVLLPELSINQDMVNRFFNEARSTALIKHIGLIDVFDFGYHENGCAYIAMEYLEGESLAALLKRLGGRLPQDYTTAIGRQVATAVGVAHARDIVHRDLKPDNIFLLPDEEIAVGMRAKVLDFGIAKLGTELKGASRTRTGSLMGTPLYMSPEQCAGGRNLDLRSDIYALGCILYEMVSGAPPFVFDGVGEIIGAHIFHQPRPISQHDPLVPPWLETVIMKALAKNPAERQQSMEELAAELGGRTSRASRPVGLVIRPPGMATPPPAAHTPTAMGGRVAGPTPVPTPAPASRPGGATPQTPPPMFAPTQREGDVVERGATTLSGAASQIRPPAPVSRRRTGLMVAGLGVAAAIGLTFALVRGKDSDKGTGAAASSPVASAEPSPAASAEPPPVAVPASSPIASAEPSPVASAEPSPVASAEPSPVAAPGVAMVDVDVTSTPSGADVFTEQGTPLGKTPLHLERAKGTYTLAMIVRANGYKDQRVELALGRNVSKKVKLSKLGKGSAAEAPATGGSTSGLADPFDPKPGTKAPNQVIDPFAPPPG